MTTPDTPALALAAIRLTRSADASSPPPRLTPADLEAFWQRTPPPAPATPREERLVHALLYQIGEDTHRNTITPEQLCTTLHVYGLPHLTTRSAADEAPDTLPTPEDPTV
ncbi:hypothetical protein [Kitasatospora cineracea]|uniref:hypothetical protein n=1 Tax=Kitasatospora cineracea TaxID=88074 RepID=UPI00382BB190